MTRTEAIQALREGKKVTHRYFSDDEFITLEGNMVIDEMGFSTVTLEVFMAYRSGISFDDGWEEYNK